jgi:chromosome segregation ATPase
MLNASEPQKFERAKDQMVLSIDSAEAEYKILSNEIEVIGELISRWNTEMLMCQKDVEAYQAEMITLDEERERIERKIRKLEALNNMKLELQRANVEGLIAETEKIKAQNEEMVKDISSGEDSNAKRKAGMQQIVSGFKKFLLVESDESIENLDELL